MLGVSPPRRILFYLRLRREPATRDPFSKNRGRGGPIGTCPRDLPARDPSSTLPLAAPQALPRRAGRAPRLHQFTGAAVPPTDPISPPQPTPR